VPIVRAPELGGVDGDADFTQTPKPKVVDENLGVPDYTAMPRPHLVGLTAFTSQANRAYELAAYFRRLGVPVVMGGIHATMCLEEVREHVDSVVTGEAERVWAQVLADTRRGGLQRRYDGGFAEIDKIPPAMICWPEGTPSAPFRPLAVVP
jgi:radical SAM superfamily enzyme YgiQ (UPF0313 family)